MKNFCYRPHLCHNHSRSHLRKRPRHNLSPPSSEATCPHQLLRCEPRRRRHARRSLCDDLQRQLWTHWRLALRTSRLRYLQLLRCILLKRIHSSPLLYLRRQILCHRQAARIPRHYDSQNRLLHASKRLALASLHQLPPNPHGLVHNRTTQTISKGPSRCLYLQSEYGVCHSILECIVLDTKFSYDINVLQNI